MPSAITLPFFIRPASVADAARIAAVHVESITTLGARSYAPAIVVEWARPCTARRYIDQMARGELFFLAVAGAAGNDTLGFSSYRLEAGKHRTAVYVGARAARQGVGTALFRVAEAEAKANGATEIEVDASLDALEFYVANGFQELSRGLHPLRSGRGSMDCVFMKKSL